MDNFVSYWNKLELKKVFILLVSTISIQLFSQTPITAYVNSSIVNVRSGPSKLYDKIYTLQQNSKVEIIGPKEYDSENNSWFKVEFYDSNYYVQTGFVSSKFIRVDQLGGWEKVNLETGSQPDCINISPEYDYSLNNYLRIKLGAGSDCIVKLYNSRDVCIRIAYVRENNDFEIKNIPEDIYHVKVAYGKDFSKKMYNGNCYVKFLRNALYKENSNLLNYYKVAKPDTYNNGSRYSNYSVPSYELSLKIVQTSSATNVVSSEISESEFNR